MLDKISSVETSLSFFCFYFRKTTLLSIPLVGVSLSVEPMGSFGQ